MNRLQRAAVLLTLLDALKERGSWCGETHLQKSVYFLQELLGVDLGFPFVLYRHGPYSFELSDEITALRADSLLNVQLRLPYGPSLEPSERAESLLANFERTRRLHQPAIDFVADRLAQHKVIDLERLATALYVTREPGRTRNVEARAARLNELKSHIALDEARRAIEDIDAICSDAEALSRQ
jgi:uncharacterized protein YwgA